MKTKTHRAVVVWGERPSGYTTHEFKTKAELAAFWDGVNAADGWLGAHNVEDILSDKEELQTMADNTGQSLRDLRKDLKEVLLWREHKLSEIQ